ncbi:MAG: carbamoyltransferase [Planctomycetes bacterium]|nr:carbamoyltransferase [Planctomycetota bacterium]MCB9904158.1 carbamoyltransferase [Planctomycetota bacterium]
MIVLGLSFYYHDSSAALVRDGVLVAAAEEERFSRLKHDSGFPHLAIEFVLAQAGVTIHDVDYVVFYEKPFVKFERMLLSAMATFPRSAAVFRESMQRWVTDKLWIKSHMKKDLDIPSSKLLFADHHMSHAASSFFTSPFEEAAILTVDGAGEWTTSTLSIGRGNRIEIVKELRFPHSLGLLYSAFTAYCGFEINEGEYKLMGMHPYGQPKYTDKIYELLHVAEDGSLWQDMRYFAYHYSRDETLAKAFSDHFGKPPRDPKEQDKSLDPYYCDMAASIQKVTEEILLKMVAHLHEITGLKHLCLAGGVALNSVANYKILRQGPFDEVYIHPAPGDDGGSVGAAYWAYNHLLRQPRGPALDHAYLGSSYTDDEIREFLESNDIEYQHIPDDEEFYGFVAQSLADGQVAGWFRGRFEWGPRALGSRSIIADPRKPEMKELLNAKIKFREAFRPFAPSVLEERADEFFEFADAEKHFPGRFMLYVAPVRPEKRDVLPAITHEDGSGRLQTVYKATNPGYHRMIERFGELTGVPVVMNTSFNLKGEPIVEHPSHAFNTFSLSGMDLLFLENFVIRADAKKKIADTKFALRHEGDSVTEMVS